MAAGAAAAATVGTAWLRSGRAAAFQDRSPTARRADIAIVGGGLGGCAAALAALRAGRTVILTEETDWIGGQLTQQGVPPDEHPWIETRGAPRSYRTLRAEIRDYYRRHYPLTAAARTLPDLNPGAGSVSRLCHEPRVALAVLEALLAPYTSGGRLQLLREHEPVSADVAADRVRAVAMLDLRTGRRVTIDAELFIDATELGDLLPMTGTELVTGAESRARTGEPHARDRDDPANQQAFTCCLAMDYVAGEDHTIDRPRAYDEWKAFVPALQPPWPGRLLDLTYTYPRTGEPRTLGFNPEGPTPGAAVNLWTYRRIAARANFEPGAYAGDITIMNWPQNDYMRGNLIGVSDAEARRHLDAAKQLSLSVLYWLQTEAPRPDGGAGWRGLRLRADVMGTADGLAKYPYVRESRRIQAAFTVLEQHVAAPTGPNGAPRAATFFDSVGVGSYAIDLHPSSGGDNYVDFPAAPFEIPLGALLPVRMDNLLPAAKNIGTTHVTNGCYRLHPVEWGIGEAAGVLAAMALERRVPPRAIRSSSTLLDDYQRQLVENGVELRWPASTPA
ncbi:MAG: FAD-dependent oxidoreductase [Acidobacteria bacterium]|nr:FAD-dependent oxidoreductase [Acidobacteriota bacterium]